MARHFDNQRSHGPRWIAAAGLALLLSACGQTSDPAGTRVIPPGVGLVLPQLVPPPRPVEQSARRLEPAERQAEVSAISPSLTPSDWPTFRGALRDGISRETGLAREWPAEGPKLAWTHRDLGRGYSGPAVVHDTVYVLGTIGQEEAAIALDLATGERRWAALLGPIFQNPWGAGPRSTPTVDSDRVYVLTPAGRLAALARSTGKILWSRQLEDDFDGEAPEWGYSESPLVDGDKLVVTPGREHAMLALDKRTGRVIWQSAGFDDGAQYSSILPIQSGGQDLYLNMTDRGLVAVSARTGQLAFRWEKTKNGTAACTMPVFHAGSIYTTSGFGAGCGLVQPTMESPREIYVSSLMKNQHGGVVLWDGAVFGYSDGAGWLCHEFATGELRWHDKASFPKGSLIAADGRLYCLSERDGTVALIEPTRQGWSERGRLTLPETTRLGRGRGGVWTHPVISHGRLFVRDQELLFAFELKR